MYAVIRTGGKQHRVEVGQVVRVDSVPGNAGDSILFDQVLMMGEGESVRVGTPIVDGAQVRGTVVEQGRARKVLVHTYKRRKNSNRKGRGHRQSYTAVKIEAIEG